MKQHKTEATSPLVITTATYQVRPWLVGTKNSSLCEALMPTQASAKSHAINFRISCSSLPA
ncbi:CLUMA_CG012339, isoform A [Clunio marinus]|uniref:CLUMA_CG012339, isoform A n=1 Tax=Clunio marinus TaxID=568069 RepID=A0A1J1IH70_9DIPT|nr:CLUMA_CG012339, isoform A [Clunio marinus]